MPNTKNPTSAQTFDQLITQLTTITSRLERIESLLLPSQPTPCSPTCTCANPHTKEAPNA